MAVRTASSNHFFSDTKNAIPAGSAVMPPYHGLGVKNRLLMTTIRQTTLPWTFLLTWTCSLLFEIEMMGTTSLNLRRCETTVMQYPLELTLLCSPRRMGCSVSMQVIASAPGAVRRRNKSRPGRQESAPPIPVVQASTRASILP